jgi:VWFA-related protein
MRLRTRVSPIAAAALAAVLAAADDGTTRESGIVERTGRRLVQLDVTITGPPDEVATLGASDFELVVGGRRIESFTLDRICDDRPSRAAAEAEAEIEAEPPAAAAPPPPPAPVGGGTTFLFYFDQGHLTMAGRHNAIDMAHDLIDQLIEPGDRAMIVSSGEELRTFAPLTGDRAALHAAVDAVEGDRKQWDPWVMSEDSRIGEIIDYINKGMLDQAKSAANRHHGEERWRAEKELRRFSMVLAHLGDVDPPKVTVYFADTMRRNPGQHYLGFFSASERRDDAGLRSSTMDSFASGSSFERVIDEASAHGVRLYTVEAQGLTTETPTSTGVMGRQFGGQDSIPTTRRVTDAQDTLVSLARETGGQAFLNGAKSTRIANRIAEDLACVYVVSFDGGELPEDSPLAVRLRVHRPKVDAQTRGRLVVQSESRALTSRLLAAFAAPEAVRAEVRSHSMLVPTGWVDGKYRALVQLAVPGSPLSPATWDFGLSLVSRGEVREDASARVTVPLATVPVVFETEMSFSPGPFEVVSVAHDTTADRVTTARLEGDWPDPDAAPATVGPIALMQPEQGVFLREDEVQNRGARALDAAELARTDRPTALVALVCRGRTGKTKLRVERALSGDTAVPFEPLELVLDEERCAQIRDVIPKGVMTPGSFDYSVRVLRGEETVASSERSFGAVAADGAHAALAPTRRPGP